MHAATKGKVAAAPQPESFEFTPENLAEANMIIARYPEGRQASAVLPLLMIVQRQAEGWVPKVAMDYVAGMLGMAPIRVYEVATFYSMYNMQPVGRHHLQVCTTTPCWLRGSDDIMKACEKKLGIASGETTADGQFTLQEVECLGACVNAPMMQVMSYGKEFRDVYYEDLTAESTIALLEALARGEFPAAGPQSPRHASEPLGATPANVYSQNASSVFVEAPQESKKKPVKSSSSATTKSTAKPSAKTPKKSSTKKSDS
ncbi:MAG: NADH-quinone oxidoreductase subunit NuoE [Rickettsiales bacterium]|nr:NADH-quinone oxidoreductase subunit NuoE [Rickettsiales bacterium]